MHIQPYIYFFILAPGHWDNQTHCREVDRRSLFDLTKLTDKEHW